MLGYGHTVRLLVARGALAAADVLELVGDSKCAECIFRKGGSQAGYVEQEDSLSLLEALLDIHASIGGTGCEVRFRWTRRCNITEADELSKYIDPMDFGLKPRALDGVQRRLGQFDVDRFAAPHNHVCARFNSLFETPTAEAADAFSVSWAEGVSFILPEFAVSFIERVLDKIERDNAAVVCVVPWWASKSFWRRLHCAAWQERIQATNAATKLARAPR